MSYEVRGCSTRTFLTSFSVSDVHAGWVEALRELGQKVIDFNLDDRLTAYSSALKQVGPDTFARMFTPEQCYELAVNGLYSTLYKARPDVLLVISGFFITSELLNRARRSGTRVVLLCTEQPYELERELPLAADVDLVLLNDPTHLDAFSRVTAAGYMPHAYRPAIHHPGAPVEGLVCDLGFVGTGYPSRVAFLEAMDLAGLDVLLAGNWQLLDEDSPLYPFLAHGQEDCLDNTSTANVYRSARIGLNLYRREAMDPAHVAGWSVGPREVEMAACGLFFLRDPRPEGDLLFPSLPAFSSPSEASEQLRWWLAHPSERTEAALKAREAIADRTFANHAAAVLRLLDQ